MIIGLALLIMIIFFGGGPEEVFLVPDLKKEINKTVKDKDRKEDLKALIVVAKKETKDFRKQIRNESKFAKKLAVDYQSDLAELNKVFMTSIESRKQHQASMINKRLVFQNLMTDDEWNSIISKQIDLKKKEQRKKNKSARKAESREEKMFAKVHEAISQEILDIDRSVKIDSAFTAFERVIAKLYDEKRDGNFQDNELIGKRAATRQELEQFYHKQDSIRENVYKSYFQLLEVGRASSSEAEWKSLVRPLARIYR